MTGVYEVVERVSRLPGLVKIVAVDGHSAAGKSTLARALAVELGAAVVRGDDFYRVMDEGQRSMLSSLQGVDLYYDWQRLRDEVLVPLRVGRQAQFHAYDWEANKLSSNLSTVDAASVVVVEGLFVSRPELAPLLDLTILVTTDAVTRESRQQERADASPEWLRRWDAAEQWYFEHVRPLSSFDLVIAGR